MARLKSLEKAASPVPWFFDCGNGDIECREKSLWRMSVADRADIMDRKAHCEQFNLKYNPPDHPVHPDCEMEFIAASRNALPLLIEALEDAIETLEVCAKVDPTFVRECLARIEEKLK